MSGLAGHLKGLDSSSRAAPQSPSSMRLAKDSPLKLIAFFKVLKGIALLILAFGILRLVHQDLAKVVGGWLEELRVDPGNKYATAIVAKVGLMSARSIVLYDTLTFAYAALFLTEGTGLFLRKRWAEWLTVISTGSLIPLEMYEVWKHPSWIKVLLLILNCLIVVYLVWRLRQTSASRRTADGSVVPAA